MSEKLTQFFVGHKRLIFSDESKLDVVIEYVVFIKDCIVALVDTDGNVFNWQFVVIVENRKADE